MIFVLLIRIFIIHRDLSLSVFLLCLIIICCFYGTYVEKVVGKATRVSVVVV